MLGAAGLDSVSRAEERDVVLRHFGELRQRAQSHRWLWTVCVEPAPLHRIFQAAIQPLHPCLGRGKGGQAAANVIF